MTSAERQSAARALLEPLVRSMVPDVRSALTITRSLITTYYNLRYIGDDARLLDALGQLKERGVLHREALDALREICRDIDSRPDAPADPHYGFLRQLNVLQDILPDHLYGEEGKIIWTADKPPRFSPVLSETKVSEPEPTSDSLDPPSFVAK